MKKTFLARTITLSLLALSSLLPIAQAKAQYPERPVNLIVPFAAGGGTDATMRAFAKAFQDVTGQPMTVENKPGGGTLIALSYLKNKQPDGYTLGVMTTAQFTQYWLNDGKVPAHPFDDIDYLVGTHGSVFALLAGPNTPFNSLGDIAKYAKENPDKPLTFGNIGAGSSSHIAIMKFAEATGMKAQHITYKGEAESNTAAMGGHIDLTVSSGAFVPFVTGNRLKMIALATQERLEEFPQWKTFREQGYDVVLTTQVGLGAPKGISAELAAQIEDIVRKVTSHPEFIAAAKRLYQPVQFLDVESYRKVVRQQSEQQRDAIRSFNLKEN